MKNIFLKSIFLVFIASTFVACDKDLEQLPSDLYSSEFAFVTYDDFENGIRGVYSLIRNTATYGSSDAGSMLSAPDILADNVIMAQDGRNSKRGLYEYTFTPNSPALSGLYQQFYEMIYRANVVLFYAEGGYTGENKDKVIAEAKALRAFAHLNLVTYWGKIPTQSADANGSLGIAYMTEADPTAEPARITVGEVYSNIVTDLTESLSGIPTASDAERGRLNKDAVNILLSRTYLYMGEWQNSINAANAVTTVVAPRDQVVAVWQDESTDGVAFLIPNDVSPTTGIGVTWSQFSPTSLVPEYVVSYEFYQLFEDDDIRKDAYTFSASNGGNQYNAIRKLLGKSGLFDGKVDWKIFRGAEAQLNKAEALFNLGQEGPARDALDAVRDNRYTSYPGGETGTALRDAIRLERRLEFAFEYQRIFDIKRWGLPLVRENFGDYADGSGTAPVIQNLPAGSNKFQLPISQDALSQNPNMVQNPGY